MKWQVSETTPVNIQNFSTFASVTVRVLKIGNLWEKIWLVLISCRSGLVKLFLWQTIVGIKVFLHLGYSNVIDHAHCNILRPWIVNLIYSVNEFEILYTKQNVMVDLVS